MLDLIFLNVEDRETRGTKQKREREQRNNNQNC